jgi:hypothetical protein
VSERQSRKAQIDVHIKCQVSFNVGNQLIRKRATFNGKLAVSFYVNYSDGFINNAV